MDIVKRPYRFEKMLSWDQTRRAGTPGGAEPTGIETCVATNTRISEVTGLIVKHLEVKHPQWSGGDPGALQKHSRWLFAGTVSGKSGLAVA